MKRFLSKVKAESVTGCWIWLGAKKPGGYGNFYLNRRYETAHRASWIIHRGAIPNGLFVLHLCDKPNCVNPDHLFLGTPKDNMADMKFKGRAKGVSAGGESHPGAKLTEKDVKTIRALRANGSKYREIAEIFRICPENASHVCRRNTWGHVP